MEKDVRIPIHSPSKISVFGSGDAAYKVLPQIDQQLEWSEVDVPMLSNLPPRGHVIPTLDLRRRVTYCGVMPNRDIWRGLTEEYCESGVVLVLGAGISTGCNLPSWEELLRRLAIRTFGSEGTSIFSGLCGSGYSFPAIAGILEGQYRSRNDFSRLVQYELYRDFPFFPAGVTDDNRAEFLAYVQGRNLTLCAVAAMCAAKDNEKNTFVRNPRVHAVVNANLDSILRSYCYLRFSGRQPRSILRTIERPSAEAQYGRTSVYHVHGFVVFSSEDFGDPTKNAPDARVFTEKDYFDFFNRPNSLFNYTFLHLLREHSCLFVGMSMRDDNIRRLLHYSRLERVESYLKERTAQLEAEQKSLRHFTLQRRSADKQIDELVDLSLRGLGVATVWMDDYSEIPTRLAELYASAGNEWKYVF